MKTWYFEEIVKWKKIKSLY